MNREEALPPDDETEAQRAARVEAALQQPTSIESGQPLEKRTPQNDRVVERSKSKFMTSRVALVHMARRAV